jgi:hypothetical protein
MTRTQRQSRIKGNFIRQNYDQALALQGVRRTELILYIFQRDGRTLKYFDEPRKPGFG